MRVFVDTNVLLDVLGHREPFYRASAQVWSLAELGEIEAYISAISFSNVYYIVRKAQDKAKADRAMRLLRDVFDSVAPDSKVINQAIDSNCANFEDGVQFHSAIRARAQFLITRNPGDFPRSKLPIIAPEEFLAAWSDPARKGQQRRSGSGRSRAHDVEAASMWGICRQVRDMPTRKAGLPPRAGQGGGGHWPYGPLFRSAARQATWPLAEG